MKKKSSTSKDTLAPVIAAEIKSLVQSHSLFFDRLVELIPARFYVPAPDDKPWFEGLSKAAKSSAKRQSRENRKKARRARHDPDNPQPSTLDATRAAAAVEAVESDGNDDDGKDSSAVAADSRTTTYEDLRRRYHNKLEELRSERNIRPESNYHSPKEGNKSRSNRAAKRKRDEQQQQQQQNTSASKEGNKKRKEDHNGTISAPIDVSFGHVKLGGEIGEIGRKKKHKLSKIQALEKARKLENAKKDPEKGAMVAKKHSWKAAESRAAGVKVHDDPKLIQESIKKEKKKKEKHAEKWKERLEGTQKVRKEKQQTRAENIKTKIDQKKMKRIEKREKKLMRAGIEGRKEGSINES